MIIMNEEQKNEPVKIYDADFGTGLLAGLANLGYNSISLNGFERKVSVSFNEWEKEMTSKGYNFRFSIRLDQLHGDSPTLRNIIRSAVYIKISKEYSDKYFNNLPATKKDWVKLAQLTIDAPPF
jgi:hypothetical protein